MEKKIISWKEWVSLPEFGDARIKAKIDTGAKSSSLHAFDLESYEHEEVEYVAFKVLSDRRGITEVIRCHARIEDYRTVRSSNGQSERRPVVVTQLAMFQDAWPIEVTLTNRGGMRYRMLLGRQSIRNRFYVDAGSPGRGKRGRKVGKRK